MDDQTFLNQLAEKLSKLGTVRPLGFHYLHPYGTVPADSIICNGATYSRALYKDFFDYITTQGWVKTEAEWQEHATRENGFCPFYSDGDGSTNFRTPRFAPFMQVAIASADAGQYHRAGLPNITGRFRTGWYHSGLMPASGAFQRTDSNHPTVEAWSSNRDSTDEYTFDASRESRKYGNSDTVQPESHEWVMCVVAYGIATNVGSVDIQNVMSAVNAVQTKVDGKLEASTVHITETWKSTDGNSWYRMWSDGWIEQGSSANTSRGSTVTLHKKFSSPAYTILAQSATPSDVHAVEFHIKTRSTTSFMITCSFNGSNNFKPGEYIWYACGY